VNKTAASAAQFAKCILLQAYLRSLQLLVSSCARTKKLRTASLTSWHNKIFCYKLRTD